MAQQRLHGVRQRGVLLRRDRHYVVAARAAFGHGLLVLAEAGGKDVDVEPPRRVADRHADAGAVAHVIAVGVPHAAVDHQHVAGVQVRLQLRRRRLVLAVAVVARRVVAEAVAAGDDGGAAGCGAELGERPESGNVHRRVGRVWVQYFLILAQAERPVAVPIGAPVAGRGDDAVRHGDAHRRAEAGARHAEQPFFGDVGGERLRLGDQPAYADARFAGFRFAPGYVEHRLAHAVHLRGWDDRVQDAPPLDRHPSNRLVNAHLRHSLPSPVPSPARGVS